jgi:hypothetical protein
MGTYGFFNGKPWDHLLNSGNKSKKNIMSRKNKLISKLVEFFLMIIILFLQQSFKLWGIKKLLMDAKRK